jgi:glycosyltransferase involved in cell wall biosynthesis
MSLLATMHGLLLLVRSRVLGHGHRALEFRALAVRRLALGGALPDLRTAVARDVCASKDHYRRLEVGWTNYATSQSANEDCTTVTTSLILKWPTKGEAGVLYLSFEYNWLRILKSRLAGQLLRDFYVVGASSWSPPDYALLASFGSSSPHPLFYGVSNDADNDYLRGFEDCARPVPLLASDWNDPERFSISETVERDIDVIMVAHWGTFKQHWILFNALAKLPSNLKVVLIGRPADGRDELSLRNDARMLGVRQELEVFTDVPSTTVRSLLRRAKVSVLLSSREGSCVAVTEALYSNTPVIMLRGAHVGSIKYINEQTGLLSTASSLDGAIRDVLNQLHVFSPRQAIVSQSNCHKSTAALNAILKSYSLSRSAPWSQDISTFCWDYMPKYVGSIDKELLKGRYGLLERDYGIRIVGWE